MMAHDAPAPTVRAQKIGAALTDALDAITPAHKARRRQRLYGDGAVFLEPARGEEPWLHCGYRLGATGETADDLETVPGHVDEHAREIESARWSPWANTQA